MRDLIFNIGNKIFVFRNKQYVRHFVQSLKVQPDTGYKGITLIIVFNIAVFPSKSTWAAARYTSICSLS